MFITLRQWTNSGLIWSDSSLSSVVVAVALLYETTFCTFLLSDFCVVLRFVFWLVADACQAIVLIRTYVHCIKMLRITCRLHDCTRIEMNDENLATLHRLSDHSVRLARVRLTTPTPTHLQTENTPNADKLTDSENKLEEPLEFVLRILHFLLFASVIFTWFSIFYAQKHFARTLVCVWMIFVSSASHVSMGKSTWERIFMFSSHFSCLSIPSLMISHNNNNTKKKKLFICLLSIFSPVQWSTPSVTLQPYTVIFVLFSLQSVYWC